MESMEVVAIRRKDAISEKQPLQSKVSMDTTPPVMVKEPKDIKGV